MPYNVCGPLCQWSNCILFKSSSQSRKLCSWINSPPKMVNPPLFCCIVLNIVNNNNNLKKKTKVQNTRPHPNAQNVHNGET